MTLISGKVTQPIDEAKIFGDKNTLQKNWSPQNSKLFREMLNKGQRRQELKLDSRGPVDFRRAGAHPNTHELVGCDIYINHWW